jgi:hypothetical protein
MLLSFNRFVNEAKREGIFTGGLKTGASQAFIDRSKKTTSYKILKFIYSAGEEGRRYTDIVKFIVEDLGGDRYDHKIHRGWWATNLIYKDPFNRDKNPLLYSYAEKNSAGRWVLNSKTREFFDLQEFGDLDISQDSIDFLSRLASTDI